MVTRGEWEAQGGAGVEGVVTLTWRDESGLTFNRTHSRLQGSHRRVEMEAVFHGLLGEWIMHFWRAGDVLR